MRRLKLLGLTLMAVFALGAVASATASAEPTVAFLPGTTETNFTTTSGTGLLESSNKKAITCTKDKASGNIKTSDEGSASVDFEGCKQGTLNCNTAKDAKGIVLLANLGLALVDTTKGAGIVFELPSTLTIECGTVLIEVKGSVIGELNKHNEEVTEAEVKLNQKSGEQTQVAYTECEETEEECKETKEEKLECNLGGKFELCGEKTSEITKFTQMVEFSV
jgi:hypothetical protein